MGIAGFTTWFQKQHASAYLPLTEAAPFDHVYVDMASILHAVLRRGAPRSNWRPVVAAAAAAPAAAAASLQGSRRKCPGHSQLRGVMAGVIPRQRSSGSCHWQPSPAGCPENIPRALSKVPPTQHAGQSCRGASGPRPAPTSEHSLRALRP